MIKPKRMSAAQLSWIASSDEKTVLRRMVVIPLLEHIAALTADNQRLDTSSRCANLSCGLAGRCDEEGTEAYPCPLRQRAKNKDNASHMNREQIEHERDAAITELRDIQLARDHALLQVERLSRPVPMLLWCPLCGTRHLDEGEFVAKPHHTHACQGCGMVWRPALVPTVGVEFLPGFQNKGEP